jgi:hypothetical protein
LNLGRQEGRRWSNGRRWRTFRLLQGETPESLRLRCEEAVAEEELLQAAQMPPPLHPQSAPAGPSALPSTSAPSTLPPTSTPVASPSARRLRQPGVAGKPSPDAAKGMEPSPPTKRRVTSNESLQSRRWLTRCAARVVLACGALLTWCAAHAVRKWPSQLCCRLRLLPEPWRVLLATCAVLNSSRAQLRVPFRRRRPQSALQRRGGCILSLKPQPSSTSQHPRTSWARRPHCSNSQHASQLANVPPPL